MSVYSSFWTIDTADADGQVFVDVARSVIDEDDLRLIVEAPDHEAHLTRDQARDLARALIEWADGLDP